MRTFPTSEVSAMFRRTAGSAALVVVLVTALQACGASGDIRTIKGADLGGTTPGSLVRAETMPQLDRSVIRAGIRAARVSYRSTDASTGKDTVVSGTVFVPDRDAPAGGWHVVALGHGSTGILNSCAPSSSPDLAEQAQLVIKLVRLGVAVTMTDYQGLGEPGVHAYLDSPTAGLNVIDSVRAARATFPGISTTWAAFGGSQGGGAVWAANEEAGSYAPELDLVGVIALAPAADVTGLVDKAVAGTLTADQRPTLQWLLASLERQHPDLDLDHYRRGAAKTYWDTLSTCAGVKDDGGRRQDAQAEVSNADLAPDSPEAAALLRKALEGWALPRKPTSAPMFVAYGEKDTFIDPVWTTRALARACQQGDVIEAHLDPEGTHAVMNAGDPAQWLADRFAGKPAKNDCPGA
ncbi:hypothetical protein ABIE44_003302 [Marmoricola sp. OAE513]|uniref:lipase family protein n=1 Tax=Marmoricola sp. OAE513 TaxID=2817894 RepID=UPI001AE5E0DA